MKQFNSILFGDSTQQFVNTPPCFFGDLQIDYLLKIIENQSRGYTVKPYFYTMPSSEKQVRFRQNVYQDFNQTGLAEATRLFCLGMFQSRQAHRYGRQCDEKVQKASYHLESAVMYLDALQTFASQLQVFQFQSEGFIQLRQYVADLMQQYDENGFTNAVTQAKEYLSQMSFQLTIDNDKLSVGEREEDSMDYLGELAALLGVDDSVQTVITQIYPGALDNSTLETELVKLLQKNKPDIFEKILSFKQQFSDFYSEKLIRFEEEVQFYLSFYEFEKKTNQLGYFFSYPSISEADEFTSEQIFDLALVWKNAIGNYHVVANDFTYPSKPSFFVVTGPNQGGKTTFARSVGQAVYFALMGLKVNAAGLTLPFFVGISTHFEVEESIKSNSGKLKEEINRLVPMMKHHIKRHFVILNELFTTATTYDAFIMGKRVMEHFLSRNCYGIYVTHIQELAEETDQIISLVAQIRDHVSLERTYEIAPMKAQGYGYSDLLVKNLELTYEDLIRRLP